MANLQEYKCPCCDGAIAFDATLQKLKCPYCGTEFEPEALMHYDSVLSSSGGDDAEVKLSDSEWSEAEREELSVYSCGTCAGEIVGDSTTAATKCPYCGNPVVMMGKFKGDLRPDLVIPFKVDKKAAIEALKRHYGGKRLLPKVFKDENTIKEIKGVYVPFWLFDAEAGADMGYEATKIRAWSDSRYHYTETSFYSVKRSGSIGFDGIPVDGSSKIDDTLMESLEPYSFFEAVDFQTAYLAGYVADRYDVDSEKSKQRAAERIKKSAAEVLRNTVTGYSGVIEVSSNVQIKSATAKYALLPVWLLTTEWNGQRYIFAVNGQTGKTVGDLPLDKGAYRKWLFGLTGVVGAVCFVLSYLFWML